MQPRELEVELNEALMPMLFWAETGATENKNHRIWPLEFRAFGASRRGRKAHNRGGQRLEQMKKAKITA
jgi:hypothetical protein